MALSLALASTLHLAAWPPSKAPPLGIVWCLHTGRRSCTLTIRIAGAMADSSGLGEISVPSRGMALHNELTSHPQLKFDACDRRPLSKPPLTAPSHGPQALQEGGLAKAPLGLDPGGAGGK